MGGMMRRRNMGIKSGGAVIDNAPVIEYYDKRIYGTGMTDDVGRCVTQVYTLPTYATKRCTVIVHSGTVTNNSCQIYADGVYKDWWNSGNYFNSGGNQGRWSLVTEDIDNSYCYLKNDGNTGPDILKGYIIFAGRNTIYYGHQYIQEVGG